MEMKNEKMGWKSHVLILPFPAQGHMNPLLQFAKRLISKGVKVTLANTIFINNSMDSDPKSPIHIQTISDGYDEGGISQAESPEFYFSTFKAMGSQSLAKLIEKLNDSDLPVSAVVYDGHLTWVLGVAKQFGVLGVVFFTQSCAVNITYYHVQRGLLPLPLLRPTVSLPGVPLLQVSDVSSFISSHDSYPVFLHVLLDQFSNIDQADWIFCSSFHKLEPEAADWMEKNCGVRTIGPTIPSKYLDQRIEDDNNYGINLFKPDTNACTNWLHGKPKGSVVYVSFGSVAGPGEEQIEEIALGLKATNCYFLWVVRETEQSKLPKIFIEEMSGKGMVVKWCPQLEVLSHEAVGCFITHCGFNSVMEALSLGVPMVGMPMWTDQPTNAKYVEDVWKVGVRAKADDEGIVRRQVIEFCIREVMEGDKGKEIKENANKWKNLAIEAIHEGGTSDKNIDEFIAKLSSPCNFNFECLDYNEIRKKL